jgi:hypothetical protein
MPNQVTAFVCRNDHTREPPQLQYFQFVLEKYFMSAHKCGMQSLFPYALWTLIVLMVLGAGLAILVW